MHHDFRDFLRHGGNGEYTIHQRIGLTFGHRLSGKSQRPGGDRQRQAFRERLETVAAENARMILQALTSPDTVPLYSESDLLPASDLIEKVLQVWDDRLADIQSRYRNHLQRIRPLRATMEDRTALAFAGMINQLRQEDMGIERYIWVTQGDHKVRSAHAALNGEIFDWDHPSEEGHPGQAPNCRCRAVPVPKDGSSVVLANYIALPEAVGDGGSSVVRAGIATIGRILGISSVAAGSFLAAVLWPTAAGDPKAHALFLERLAAQQNASRDLGLETQDPAAFMAAVAYVLGVESEFGFSFPPEESRIAGQAATLYELAAPGTIDRFQHDDPDARSALRGFVLDAVQAYRDGRLRLTADGWAQGWTEVFPELTEDERRLADLPGFTAEQQEAFILADPAQNDGLPAHTGHVPEGDPVGNVTADPIAADEGPNVLEARRGRDFVTPGGNVISQHGSDESGKDYIEGRKGHTGKQIDDIIAMPDRTRSGYVQAKGRRKGEKIRLFTGQDGHWVKVDEAGRVIASSNRHLPLKHKENDPGEIIEPLEK